MINLHEESLYLLGAREMLLKLLERAKLSFGCFNLNPKTKRDDIKSGKVYDKVILDFLLSDRENIRRYLQGDILEFYDHKYAKDGKFYDVKVKFKE